MKKVVLVAFHLGRVGSSALMGLLDIAGLNVGGPGKLTPARPMNPKGFFELKAQQRFMEKAYSGIYPHVTDPPPLETVDSIGEQYAGEYRQLLREEFRDTFPIAIKSQRFLTLPFFHRLREHYTVKVVVMERNLPDQVDSTLRVWSRSPNPHQANATREFVTQYIKKWRSFADDLQSHYSFPYFHISFDELMADPIANSREIFDFIGEACPTGETINRWLDRSLINRPRSEWNS